MKQLAKISGVAYLMIFIAGFYANFTILESLIDTSNASVTTTNLINNHFQLGAGLLGFVVMLFFDLVLVWSLFGLTKSVSITISNLASFFRLLHATFFGVALLKLWKIYWLTNEVGNAASIQNRVMELLTDFDILWTVGLLFFGIHLVALGYLLLKSTYLPKALGVLLILAAIGYMIDGIAKLFIPNYHEYKPIFEVIVILPSIIGEFSLTIWLLVKGFKKQKSKKFAEVL